MLGVTWKYQGSLKLLPVALLSLLLALIELVVDSTLPVGMEEYDVDRIVG